MLVFQNGTGFAIITLKNSAGSSLCSQKMTDPPTADIIA
jgi:hypothetical protein